MKINSLICKTAYLILASFIGTVSYSQKLPDSRQTSYYTYIYRLTEKEAEKIYKSDIWEVDKSFFHTLVDSFATDGEYTSSLPGGDYLRTFSEKNKQKLSITTVRSFDVFILNNNTDLCIQVYDLKGNLIPDAKVRVRWKKLHFNKKTQSYIDKKSNQKGLLRVTHNGFTAYYKLNRQYNNSAVLRGTRKLVYQTPVKYVWRPVRFIVRVPIDATKSIIRRYPQGTISRSRYFFENSFNKVACIFDDYYCCHSQSRFARKQKGYMVFNKPKYTLADTVKLKAFLVTAKGNTIKKPLKLILHTDKKEIELTKLQPYRDGGYEYQFVLHDSLQLKLDQNYSIGLEKNRRKKYISGSFKYEDYELSKTKLSLSPDKSEQYRNQDLKIKIKGTDENDLNLLDARIEVLLTTRNINGYFAKQIFVPDTLLFLEKKLEPKEETEISISDTIFPEVDFNYEISVRLITSDNEIISKTENIIYYYYSEEFNTSLLDDSILFVYHKNGVPANKNVSITADDNFGNKTPVFKGELPCTLKVNPYFASYTVTSGKLSETVNISDKPSLLQCYSERTSDSIFIVVENPRKIPFSYNIYKRNKEKAAGFGDSLFLNLKSHSKQNYFVSLRYLWGGRIKEETYSVPLTDKKLNVSVTQPKIVYPGQKSRIEVRVSDYEGKPVENVDLTAYSMTKKFNYSPPSLPYLGKGAKNKSIINNFNFPELKTGQHGGLPLNYNAWKTLAEIDSIEYYRFLYPEKSIYRFSYPTDNSRTQFAPFVVSNGTIQPIHVIYLDGKPVYFSWSTNIQPYSFGVENGYHQVALRTSFRYITIDSLYFRAHEKLIFSLEIDSVLKNVRTQKVKPELSNTEKRLLYKYIFPYRNTFGERFAFIEQPGEVQFLKPASENTIYYNLAGPVSGQIEYNLLDSFVTNFYHEPFFEYDFAPGLLKMRSKDAETYPVFLNSFRSEKSLKDEVQTKKALNEKWQQYLNEKRYSTARYRYPASTSAGAGSLLLNFTKPEHPVDDVPLNLLVFRYDNPEFIRVYPGNTSKIEELKEGYHRLILFYPGAKYHIIDSISIRPNGLNYYETEQPQNFTKDAFSEYVSGLIEETLFKPSPQYYQEVKELKQIYNQYQQNFRYTGDGEMVEGYVYDNDTKEPIPYANVVIKGTAYGTITDLTGYYSLKVPESNTVLQFSFIGYMQEEKTIVYDNILNVNLIADVLSLDEVVVVGYGVTRSRDLASSVVRVTTSGMLRGIPGVSGNISGALHGKMAGIEILSNSGAAGSGVEIKIRGVSSFSSDSSPLYIIDGIVFNGDISQLDPTLIQNIEILKDASAVAIYGARAANGVVIIDTKPGSFKQTMSLNQNSPDPEGGLFEGSSPMNSLRDNFSDYAFWNPKLTTNKEGKASFEVTFPDDITSWETFFLAMNGKKQSGQTQSRIKSYKPLMAQLATPRFLTESDTSYVIGKVLNYSPDSVEITTNFEVNNESKYSAKNYCRNSLTETLPVIAFSDSIPIKYSLKMDDGYFDGELRNIPVFPKGLEETKGSFHVLDRDTTLVLQSDTTSGLATLYAGANILEVFENEISRLLEYKYWCNEQVASKLKALLAERMIAQYKGEKFRNDFEVERLIRLLHKNQKEKGLWGWWKESKETTWISSHVLEALSQAELDGYNTKINKAQVTGQLIWEFENNADLYSKIRILKILNQLKASFSFETYIKELEKTKKLSLNELLQIIELKQLCKLEYSLDSLKQYQKTTLFGNVYFEEENGKSNLLVNNVQNTLIVYRILRADSHDHSETLRKIRNYFLENRKTGCWRNTYESAQIIETILPDLLGGKTELTKPVLTLKGEINKTITEFPFEMKYDPGKKQELTKTGSFPLYLTSYQRYWNKKPLAKKSDFEIKTHFENDSALTLKAGKETTLFAEVVIKKDAEYVMISIPIPGGCSYGEKENNLRNESHREYFRNECAIFCERLNEGTYRFEVKLIPRYTGSYTLNPAKIELMYFPVFNANNESKNIRIK